MSRNTFAEVLGPLGRLSNLRVVEVLCGVLFQTPAELQNLEIRTTLQRLTEFAPTASSIAYTEVGY